MKTTIRAARGSELSCLGWPQEAALRMLQNNLDPEVAEHPEELVVYGGTGKAARDWASFDAIVRTLKTLKDDETLLVQSGRPVGVLTTHEWAPRVLIANSNLVGDWANWDEFRRLEAAGLTMYGQMTAGSWIYIGTQGILQGTYETFAAVGEKRFGGSLAGTITLTGGLGGMGGAQPLAVTMAGGVAICVEVDPSRIARRLETGYLDVEADGIDHALELATTRGRPALDRPARQLRRRRAGAAGPQGPDRHRDRPDQRPRSLRLPAERDRLRGLGRGPPAPRFRRPRARVDGPPRRGHGRLPGRRRRGVRLRQLDPRRGQARRLRPRVRLPRLRARLHPAAVLRGQGPVPVGGAVRRPERHRGHRPRRARAVPGARVARPVDEDGGREGPLPGPPGADLLARRGRAPPRGAALQRAGGERRDRGADRDRPRPPRLRVGRVARTARPRRCSTAPTRSPTGRC